MLLMHLQMARVCPNVSLKSILNDSVLFVEIQTMMTSFSGRKNENTALKILAFNCSLGNHCALNLFCEQHILKTTSYFFSFFCCNDYRLFLQDLF